MERTGKIIKWSSGAWAQEWIGLPVKIREDFGAEYTVDPLSPRPDGLDTWFYIDKSYVELDPPFTTETILDEYGID